MTCEALDKPKSKPSTVKVPLMKWDRSCLVERGPRLELLLRLKTSPNSGSGGSSGPSGASEQSKVQAVDVNRGVKHDFSLEGRVTDLIPWHLKEEASGNSSFAALVDGSKIRVEEITPKGDVTTVKVVKVGSSKKKSRYNRAVWSDYSPRGSKHPHGAMFVYEEKCSKGDGNDAHDDNNGDYDDGDDDDRERGLDRGRIVDVVTGQKGPKRSLKVLGGGRHGLWVKAGDKATRETFGRSHCDDAKIPTSLHIKNCSGVTDTPQGIFAWSDSEVLAVVRGEEDSSSGGSDEVRYEAKNVEGGAIVDGKVIAVIQGKAEELGRERSQGDGVGSKGGKGEKRKVDDASEGGASKGVGGTQVDLDDAVGVPRSKRQAKGGDDSDADADADADDDDDDDNDNEETIEAKLATIMSQMEAEEDSSDDDADADGASGHGGPSTFPARSAGLTVLLEQALDKGDDAQIEMALRARDQDVIRDTVVGLTPVKAMALLNALISRLSKRPTRASFLTPWIKCLLLNFSQVFGSSAQARKKIEVLRQMCKDRTDVIVDLMVLEGRLGLLLE